MRAVLLENEAWDRHDSFDLFELLIMLVLHPNLCFALDTAAMAK